MALRLAWPNLRTASIRLKIRSSRDQRNRKLGFAKSIHRWWHRCALSPETPELCDVLVIYPKLRQRYWEHVPIELWIGARPRHRTNVNNKLDCRLAQYFDEFCNRTCRVSDAEEWMRHLRTHSRLISFSRRGSCAVNRTMLNNFTPGWSCL
jgi:hypothetical protein